MPDWSEQKQKLLDRLAELDTNIHRYEDELDAPHSRDDEDRAIETEQDEVLESLGKAGLEEIRMIRAALDRIENDTYGVCQQCGEDILPARLDVLPFTPLCRTCARKV